MVSRRRGNNDRESAQLCELAALQKGGGSTPGRVCWLGIAGGLEGCMESCARTLYTGKPVWQ